VVVGAAIVLRLPGLSGAVYLLDEMYMFADRRASIPCRNALKMRLT